jgi:hypothetical protein
MGEVGKVLKTTEKYEVFQMNQQSHPPKEKTDWLSGIIFGLLTYGVQVMLHQMSNGLGCDFLYSGYDRPLARALLEVFLEMIGPEGLYLPFFIFFEVDYIDIGHVPAILIWSLCGALLFRKWGLRRGALILLVLQAVVICVASAYTFVIYVMACNLG